MILNAKLIKEAYYLKGFFKIFFYLIARVLRINSSIKIWEGFRLSSNAQFPKLILDENLDFNCDSCGKCVEVCPTNCILVEGEEGKEPKTFDVRVVDCIGCSLCQDICPQEVISMGRLNSDLDYLKYQVVRKKDLFNAEENNPES